MLSIGKAKDGIAWQWKSQGMKSEASEMIGKERNCKAAAGQGKICAAAARQ